MVELYKGDCLIESNKIESGSVDLILTDLPYGNMNTDGGRKLGINGWDLAIEPKKVYEIANRILRKNGKMILFSQEPYTTKLITEAIPNIPFSYRATWEKDNFAVALGANKNMVSFTEDVLVFSKKYDIDNLHPLRDYFKKVLEYLNGHTLKSINKLLGHRRAEHCFYLESTQFGLCTEKTYEQMTSYFHLDLMKGYLSYYELKQIEKKYSSTFNLWEGKKYKSNILKYKKDYDGHHPTQKPVLLLEDLIKTFSNENDLVVDLTIGSGSTMVACQNTNRNGIGIEMDDNYFNIAKKRIEDNKMKLF